MGSLGVRQVGGQWQEDCWVRLMDWKLSIWAGVDLWEQARSPGRVVRVDQETKVKDGGREEADTFTLENYGEEVLLLILFIQPLFLQVVELRCPTRDKKTMWMSHLYQHACDQRRWRQAAVEKMEVGASAHAYAHAHAHTGAEPRHETRSRSKVSRQNSEQASPPLQRDQDMTLSRCGSQIQAKYPSYKNQRGVISMYKL